MCATTVNHWAKGTDGEWGVAKDPNQNPHPAADDDSNGNYDDAAPAPPFEPGHGDDVRLSSSSVLRQWYWADAWPLPSPDLAPNTPEESEAINASDAAMNEGDYAHADWGNPGKNHLTSSWQD